MAWITLRWKSALLGKQTSAEVLVPDSGPGPFPVLYLLHGLSDDATLWLRRSRIESYVLGLPVIVVMPDGYRSFYTDHVQGPPFARHYGEELPDLVERLLPAGRTRESRAVGGLSMGGYGALRIGLGYADRFGSIHCHSGAVGWGGHDGVDAYRAAARDRGWTDAFVDEMLRIFGPSPAGTPHDVVHLAQVAMRAGNLPRLWLDCGTEDFLIGDNRRLHHTFEASGVAHRYHEFPGAHTWDYWDLHVRDALAFHCEGWGISR
ncbi:MAG: alpha/beta hydrolase family protein [Opitutaceae bacterium]